MSDDTRQPQMCGCGRPQGPYAYTSEDLVDGLATDPPTWLVYCPGCDRRGPYRASRTAAIDAWDADSRTTGPSQ